MYQVKFTIRSDNDALVGWLLQLGTCRLILAVVLDPCAEWLKSHEMNIGMILEAHSIAKLSGLPRSGLRNVMVHRLRTIPSASAPSRRLRRDLDT